MGLGTMEKFSIDFTALAVEAPVAAEKYRKRKDKFQTIVADAKRVLQQEGFSGFTLRRVASEAAVPLGTLQHYFPTRELLIRAVILQTIQGFNENYERIAQGNAPAKQRLETVVLQVLGEIHDRDTRIFLLEIAAIACHYDFASEVLEQSHRNYLNTLSRLIAEINPSLSARDCDLRALLIAAQLEGLIFFFQSAAAERMPDAEALKQAVVMVTKSLSSVA